MSTRATLRRVVAATPAGARPDELPCATIERWLRGFSADPRLRDRSLHYMPCPCCGSLQPKHAYDFFGGRKHVRCPRCGSVERHRAACFSLATRGMLHGTMLHFGPIPAMEAAITAVCPRARLTHLGVDFFATDERGRRYDVGQASSTSATLFADVRDLRGHGTGSIDSIVILHVLEHVDRIARAIGEIHRVLAPAGKALIEVPCSKVSYRGRPLAMSIDCRNETEEGRTRRCGQRDHVWRFKCTEFEQRLTHGNLSCTDTTTDTFRRAGPFATVAMKLDRPAMFPQYVCSKR